MADLHLGFWSLIEKHVHEGLWLDHGELDAEVGALDCDQRTKAHVGFQEALRCADSEHLWQAGGLIAGAPLGDDSFSYFQRALILLGRADFHLVVRDSDAMIEVFSRRDLPLDIDHLWEEDLGLIEQSGVRMLPLDDLSMEARSMPRADLLAKRFPRLWGRFGSDFGMSPEMPQGAESVDVPGVGLIRVGGQIMHRHYGVCTIQELRSGVAKLDFNGRVKWMIVAPEFFVGVS